MKKIYILSVLFLCLNKTYIISDAEENDGYREVEYVEFSGVPDEEKGTPGIGVDGDVWDGTNYYDKNGILRKDVFFCDGVYTYYLQYDGTPMKDRLTYHPDGQHIIYFDSEGHEAFDKLVEVKYDMLGNPVEQISYFGTYGYMYIDELTYAAIEHPYEIGAEDKSVFCYFNEYGELQKNGWFRFKDGNYGYACMSGGLITNRFGFDPFGRVVFYHWNGQVAKGLIEDDTYYYSMSTDDGHLLGMWRKDDFSNVFMMDDTSSIYTGIYDFVIQGDNVITRMAHDNSLLNSQLCWIKNRDDFTFAIFKAPNGVINTIDGSDDIFTTNRGISVGSTKSDVWKKYNFDNEVFENKESVLKNGSSAESIGMEDSIYHEQIDECLKTAKSVSCIGMFQVDQDKKFKSVEELGGKWYPFEPVIYYYLYFYYDENDEVILIKYSISYSANECPDEVEDY